MGTRTNHSMLPLLIISFDSWLNEKVDTDGSGIRLTIPLVYDLIIRFIVNKIVCNVIIYVHV